MDGDRLKLIGAILTPMLAVNGGQFVYGQHAVDQVGSAARAARQQERMALVSTFSDQLAAKDAQLEYAQNVFDLCLKGIEACDTERDACRRELGRLEGGPDGRPTSPAGGARGPGGDSGGNRHEAVAD